jgi:hypothetical protein
VTKDQIESLTEILYIITVGDWHGHHIDVLEAAIKELIAAPPADCVSVRIAVAVDDRGNVGAFGIDETTHPDQAIGYARIQVNIDRHPITHEAIVTAQIPKRSIPIVIGTVSETSE